MQGGRVGLLAVWTCLGVTWTVLRLGEARFGFVKDQTMDVEFPPRIVRPFDSHIPVGHLRPLGWQRQPESKVPETSKLPTPQQLYEKYVKTKRPLVMRGALKDVSAVTLWEKDDYLKEKYGHLDVHVAVKKEHKQYRSSEKLKFSKFLKDYMYEDWYLSNIVPTEMMKDLSYPSFLACGVRRYMIESELWMSSGGTSSLLHSHADHDLHCLLAGRKDFVLVHPIHKEKVNYVPKDPHPGAGYSPMDPEMINLYKFKRISEVPWTWTTLKQGDCIFMPAGYLHQVRSSGRSISSTMHWAPNKTIDFQDCKGVDLAKPVALTAVNFMFSYTHGDRHVTDMHLTADTLRQHLNVLMREEDELGYGLFADFYKEIMSEIDEYPEVESVWKKMQTEDLWHISRDELYRMDDKILTEIANILNSAHAHHLQQDKDEL